jgi:prepilin-type processing-associated H-X9-DG protein
MYAQDHDEHYPKANAWEEALQPYLKDASVLHCPDDPKPGTSYAMNMKLSGVSMARVEDPANTVLFYESTSQGKNGHGVGEDVAWWHSGQTAVAYADAHVKLVSEAPTIQDFRLEKTVRPAMTAPPRRPSPAPKARPKKR